MPVARLLCANSERKYGFSESKNLTNSFPLVGIVSGLGYDVIRDLFNLNSRPWACIVDAVCSHDTRSCSSLLFPWHILQADGSLAPRS